MHIRHGDDEIRDEEGSEHSSLVAAIQAATTGAREILSEQMHLGEPLGGPHIQICDADGEEIAIVKFRDTFTLLND